MTHFWLLGLSPAHSIVTGLLDSLCNKRSIPDIRVLIQYHLVKYCDDMLYRFPFPTPYNDLSTGTKSAHSGQPQCSNIRALIIRDALVCIKTR